MEEGIQHYQTLQLIGLQTAGSCCDYGSYYPISVSWTNIGVVQIMGARQLNMLYLAYLITEQISHFEWDVRRRGLGVSAVTGLVMTARDLSPWGYWSFGVGTYHPMVSRHKDDIRFWRK